MSKPLQNITPELLHALSVPSWLAVKLTNTALSWVDRTWTEDECMQLSIDISRWNVEHGTGGPFGAAIFCRDSGQLISVGVNCVVSSCDPTAHAEVSAMRLACQRLAQFDLSSMCLYTSAQPCCMCLGAILWSGIREVYFAASKSQVEAIGFDEGPMPPKEALDQRQLALMHFPGSHGEHERAATDVLREYCDQGGLIYNGGKR